MNIKVYAYRESIPRLPEDLIYIRLKVGKKYFQESFRVGQFECLDKELIEDSIPLQEVREYIDRNLNKSLEIIFEEVDKGTIIRDQDRKTLCDFLRQ